MRSAKQQEIMAALGLPAGALVVSLLVFGVFVAGSGANPFTAYSLDVHGWLWDLVFLAKYFATGGTPDSDGALYGHSGAPGPGDHWW